MRKRHNIPKGKQLVFTPTVMTTNDHDYIFDGKQAAHWSHNPLIKYDIMDMPATHGINRHATRSNLDVRDDVLFYASSGSLQYYKDEKGTCVKNITKNITLREIVEWQLNHGDIIEIPYDLMDLSLTGSFMNNRNRFLKKSLSNSIHKLQYACNAMDNSVYSNCIRSFVHLDGFTLGDMRSWYDSVSNVSDPDGYEMRVTPTIPHLLLLRLAFMMEYGRSKPFRITGYLRPVDIPLIVYANAFMKTQIYFDSGTCDLGKKHRTLSPFTMGWNWVGIEIPSWAKHLPGCECNCCKLELTERESKQPFGYLCSLHNIHLQSRQIADINEIHSNNEEIFHDYIKINFEREYYSLLRGFEFLNYVHDKGIEQAWAYYFGNSELRDEYELIDEHKFARENCKVSSKIKTDFHMSSKEYNEWL